MGTLHKVTDPDVQVDVRFQNEYGHQGALTCLLLRLALRIILFVTSE